MKESLRILPELTRKPLSRQENLLENIWLFVEELEKRGVKIPIHHVSNSASIIGFSEANLDMVRSGITTYGLYPSDEVAKDVLILEPAMQWKSIISYIKTVEPGTSISYGGTFTAKEKNDGRYNSGWLC